MFNGRADGTGPGDAAVLPLVFGRVRVVLIRVAQPIENQRVKARQSAGLGHAVSLITTSPASRSCIKQTCEAVENREKKVEKVATPRDSKPVNSLCVSLNCFA